MTYRDGEQRIDSLLNVSGVPPNTKGQIRQSPQTGEEFQSDGQSRAEGCVPRNALRQGIFKAGS